MPAEPDLPSVLPLLQALIDGFATDDAASKLAALAADHPVAQLQGQLSEQAK